MAANDRVKCRECGWRGALVEILTAANPFDSGNICNGCPNCKDINVVETVCCVNSCWSTATCGTPTKRGYMNVCGEHYRKLEREDER